QRRTLRHGDFDSVLLDRRAVQHTEITGHRRCGPLPRAEAFLAADEQRDAGPEPGLASLQETDQAAEMVVVPVAEDQCVQCGGVNTENLSVVGQRLRRVTEVHQRLPGYGSAARFDV